MRESSLTPIAVVGMACRLPGGIDSSHKLWEALLRGDDMVTEVPADVLASIRRNKVCFKGTLFTPLSEHNTSTQSLNVQLRKGKEIRRGEKRKG